MTKEFREGERDERPEGQPDDLEELRGHIKARREEAGKEGDEGQSRATEDDNPADRLGEKDSPQPESPRGSSERSQENHTEQPKEENVKKRALPDGWKPTTKADETRSSDGSGSG